MKEYDKKTTVNVLILLFISCKGESTKETIVPKRGFHSNQIAQTWEEFLVTGNGTMGAMIAGNPYSETMIINHSQLYLPIHAPIKPVSQGAHIKRIRKMMLNGEFSKASQFVVDLANSEGYKGKHATDPFIPAFQINFKSEQNEIKDYSRIVDFSTGEVNVRWEDKQGGFSRQTFVSRPDNVIVIRLSSKNKTPIHTTIDLSQVTTHDQTRRKKFGLNENLGIKEIEYLEIEKGLSFKAWYENTWEGSFKGYEGIIKVAQGNGEISTKENKLHINGATEVLLFVRIEPSHDMDESLIPGMLNNLNSLPCDYHKLLTSHEKIHKELFERVSLNLNADKKDYSKSAEELLKTGGTNPALIEKIFDASRYNILCATGNSSPNLQGIWGATMTAPWSGDYTTNGNLPVAISHYLQANTPELILPLFNQLEYFLDDFKTNAKELFNCRGIHVPSRFSTHGLNNHFDATWPMTFWTAGAAWYSMFFYDYYLYTLDKSFLSNHALPFMEQAALFYEDFLTVGEDGVFIFNPSYSPENRPSNSDSQACINATMDIMAANSLFRTIIEASNILGVNQHKIPLWKSMLKKMPAYQLNENKEIREWLWRDLQDNHNHRHASHLFGLFDLHDPLILENPELIEGCKRAINRRMDIRIKDQGGIMSYGMIQLAFSASSINETELAYNILEWLGNSYWNNNFVSTHDPHKTFNLDISGGYPSLIMKMLVYSDIGLISLLPNLPNEWPTGSIKGVALRGGILMEELKWNKEEVYVVLRSKVDQDVKLNLKGNTIKEIHLEPEKSISFSFSNFNEKQN